MSEEKKFTYEVENTSEDEVTLTLNNAPEWLFEKEESNQYSGDWGFVIGGVIISLVGFFVTGEEFIVGIGVGSVVCGVSSLFFDYKNSSKHKTINIKKDNEDE